MKSKRKIGPLTFQDMFYRPLVKTSHRCLRPLLLSNEALSEAKEAEENLRTVLNEGGWLK